MFALVIHEPADHAARAQPFNESQAAAANWTHLSTATGDLPKPSDSVQQVLSLILDIDGDRVNDFVIGSRRSPGPALVWYRRTGNGWNRYIIENSAMNMEAGAAYYDIDGDGDLDITAGNNNSSNQI